MATESKENNVVDARNTMATEKAMPKSRSPQWTYIYMVPSFWRGCWFLYGHYVFPGNPASHGWIMTAIGNLVEVPLHLMQNKLTRWLGNPHPITWLLGYHSFLLVFILTSVAQWKGIWQLLDHYTGLTVSSAMSSAAIAVVVLTMLKCCKSVSETSPLAIEHDTSRDTLLTPTRFDRHKSDNCYHFFLDTMLTIAVINNLVVFFWRGTWTALDLLLYPDDLELSAFVSLGVACCLAVILYATQFRIAAICRRVERSDSLLLSTLKQSMLLIIVLISGVCTVGFWRGVWYLWDVYLWPEDPVKSAWFTFGLGYRLLTVLGVSSSLIVRSYVLDDYIPGYPDKLFPVECITYWLSQNNQVIFKIVEDQDEKMTSQLHKEMRLIENVT